MINSRTILVTGANKGIGLAIFFLSALQIIRMILLYSLPETNKQGERRLMKLKINSTQERG